MLIVFCFAYCFPVLETGKKTGDQIHSKLLGKKDEDVDESLMKFVSKLCTGFQNYHWYN